MAKVELWRGDYKHRRIVDITEREREREAIVSTAVNIFAVCEVAEGLTDFLLSVCFMKRIAQWIWLKRWIRGGIFNYFNGISLQSGKLTSASWCRNPWNFFLMVVSSVWRDATQNSLEITSIRVPHEDIWTSTNINMPCCHQHAMAGRLDIFVEMLTLGTPPCVNFMSSLR